jgi:hypothetical protein
MRMGKVNKECEVSAPQSINPIMIKQTKQLKQRTMISKSTSRHFPENSK